MIADIIHQDFLDKVEELGGDRGLVWITSDTTVVSP